MCGYECHSVCCLGSAVIAGGALAATSPLTWVGPVAMPAARSFDRPRSPAAGALGTVSRSSGNVTGRRHPSSCSAVYNAPWAASPRAATVGASAGCGSGNCHHR